MTGTINQSNNTHNTNHQYSPILQPFIVSQIFKHLQHQIDKYNAMLVAKSSWSYEGIKALYSDLCLRTTRLVDITGHQSQQQRSDMPLWCFGDRLRKLSNAILGTRTINPGDLVSTPTLSLSLRDLNGGVVANGDINHDDDGHDDGGSSREGSQRNEPLAKPHGHYVKTMTILIYIPDALPNAHQMDADISLLASYLSVPLSELLYIPPPSSPNILLTAQHVKNAITGTCTLDLAYLAQILPVLNQVEKVCCRFVVVPPDGLPVAISRPVLELDSPQQPTTDAMMNFAKVMQTLQPASCKTFEAVIGGCTRSGVYAMLLLNAYSGARKRVGLYPLDYIRPKMLRDLFLSTNNVVDLELCHRSLTDGSLSLLAEPLQNLEKLTISVDPHSTSSQTDPNVCSIVSQSLNAFLASHPTLKSVRIYGLNVLDKSTQLLDDDMAVHVSQFGINLTTLFLPDCYFLRGQGVLTTSWTLLQHLNLEGCIYASAPFLGSIASSCIHLVTVNVSHTLCDTTAFIQFMKCKNLQIMSARNCEYLGLSVLPPLVTALCRADEPVNVFDNHSIEKEDDYVNDEKYPSSWMKKQKKKAGLASPLAGGMLQQLQQMDLSLSINPFGQNTLPNVLTSNLVKALLYLGRLCPNLELIVVKYTVGSVTTQDTAAILQIFKSWYLRRIDSVVGSQSEGIDVKSYRRSWDEFAEMAGILSFERIDLTPHSPGWKMWVDWQDATNIFRQQERQEGRPSFVNNGMMDQKMDLNAAVLPMWRSAVPVNTIEGAGAAANILTQMSGRSPQISGLQMNSDGSHLFMGASASSSVDINSSSVAYFQPDVPILRLPPGIPRLELLEQQQQPQMTLSLQPPQSYQLASQYSQYPTLLPPIPENQIDQGFITTKPQYAHTVHHMSDPSSPPLPLTRPSPEQQHQQQPKQKQRQSSDTDTYFLPLPPRASRQKELKYKEVDSDAEEVMPIKKLAELRRQKEKEATTNSNGNDSASPSAEDEFPFACGIKGCDRKFRNSRAVLRHRAWHTNPSFRKGPKVAKRKAPKSEPNWFMVATAAEREESNKDDGSSSPLSETGDCSS
ncbi:hypothetical protein SmJEL517_g00647 [Synchytrium microbalum]|uniref:C2H2-type domain-containing protein n=1 Tax=Synchytrium microbalum TaxID=1806994 RepID=A0A507CE14_9FUNG|nr:uncharacterized protein SmJEL517_g00647 [Synchytrium microbalum]TPX37419.1 hypothetical protein SmJEL517_g00647 [Synchytrium microbalum]